MRFDGLSDLWDWWRLEIAHCWLKWGRNRPKRPASPIIRISTGEMMAEERSSSRIGVANPMSAGDDLRSWLGSQGHRRKEMVQVVICPDHVLERHLASFRLPRSRFGAMVKFDIKSSTPMSVGDVIAFRCVDDWGYPAQRYFIVKWQTLRGVVDTLQRLRTSFSIWIDHTEGLKEIQPIGDTALIGSMRPQHNPKRAVVAGAAILAIMISATFLHEQWRLRGAIQDLDERIVQLTSKAKAVRAIIDERQAHIAQIAAVREQKSEAVPVTAVWEEMSRVLPDAAWLTDFGIKAQRITISGYAASASALIPLIDRSPLFRQPEFVGSVNRVPGQDGERFTIQLTLQQP